MIPYALCALISVTIFALVHLFAQKSNNWNWVTHGRFLSFGGGVAIAYVFVDLLPKLAQSDLVVHSALIGVFPYVEKHAYVMALLGFLLFYAVDKGQTVLRKKEAFLLSLGSYALFNFLVGYAVVDKDNPEVRPLLLFTFALALHYFAIDYSLTLAHGKMYAKTGKWILIASLFAGWFAGTFFMLPPTAIALVSAFIGGGVIMNVTRHELPEENPHSMGTFISAAVLYTIILLAIG